MSLPEDVVYEILSKLPVKSLMRFRCVCKSWSGLVKTPKFISKHLNTRRIFDNKDIACLLVSRRDNITNKRVISLSTNDSITFVDQHLPVPFLNENFGHIRLLGPSNGIVCLYGFPDNIALWNPAIRDFKILPAASPTPRPPGLKVRGGDLGFGFDSKTNDYKVVQILFCCSNQLQVEIYNLRTDSWRKYNGVMPAKIMYNINVWSMAYKNDIFCWWAQEDDVEVILSFDMSHEMFQKTQLPSNINIGLLGGEHRTVRAIVPLNESISLIVYHLKQVEKFFDIWVMKEFGIEESWTRLSTIGPLSRVERPLGFWKNGELILENSSGQLVMYDPGKQQTKSLGLHGKRDRLEVLIYKESLVSISRGTKLSVI